VGVITQRFDLGPEFGLGHPADILESMQLRHDPGLLCHRLRNGLFKFNHA
jgi:hypothetical protein